jgi:hypothetical protein
VHCVHRLQDLAPLFPVQAQPAPHQILVHRRTTFAKKG